uniref:ABC1 atypical kinase-like domain-containing protein n=1 Tax=Picocystis salinarum TaxID=88271 RepID=A0A7S3XDT7_9CHLO|eukprot:CAMPEP_0183832242 /NCGR_PEP_ID=MMETSP0807_2-20130328/5238_1 /TAXON_ID=88271 /ORGANISM="Picocystis salinarum, Strain CCMP1897" /LENGTH=637 /DNA_ID=CAMNT_0026077873 /DNA_START=23 /DNA_END=1936 /DNA_ORIENTATION=-
MAQRETCRKAMALCVRSWRCNAAAKPFGNGATRRASSHSSTSTRPAECLERSSEASASQLAGGGNKSWMKALVESRMQKKLETSGTSMTAIISAINTAGQGVVSKGLPLLISRAILYRTSSCVQLHQITPFELAHLLSRKTLWQRFMDTFWFMWRSFVLTVLFLPLMLTGAVCMPFGIGRALWLTYLRRTLEVAGPAWVKWGQWSSTRRDLFPADMCQELTKLQSSAPIHSLSYTKEELESAFQIPLDALFSDFSPKPVASGSIAQVYHAYLTKEGAKFSAYPAGTPVAVKVRHPGVEKKIRTDFEVMQTLAYISSKIPGLANMRLEESIRQFAMPLFEQVDLELEAEHLRRFIYNFRRMKGVSFPEPIYPLVSPSVLVETYEEGESMARYLEMLNNETDPRKLEENGVQKTDMFKPLAILGCKTLLQMMLRDNFVHADLHPGNILVRIDKPEKPWDVMLNQFVTGDTSPRPHVVLLDVGMTAELSNTDQMNLHGFFESVLELDGESAAKYILAMSPWQGCPDPEGFKSEVGSLFKSFDNMMSSGVTDVSLCMNTVLDSVRKYHVNIQGNILSVVVTTLVLEGWATKLDPDVSIITTIRQTLAFKDPIHWIKKSFERTADMLLSPTYRELMSEYMVK